MSARTGCTLRAMGLRALVLASMLAVLVGCAAIPGLAPDAPAAGPAPPFEECRAESYAFVGRATFNQLGLTHQSATALPDPDRPAMIWVTRDPVHFDAAGPGGSRMLCFEFEDGSGGSEWPVNAEWQPPGAAAAADVAARSSGTNWTIPALVVAVVALLVAGGLAFRRGDVDRQPVATPCL